MRNATAIAMVLAILLGVLAISQVDDLASSLQAVLPVGPLVDFVGFWPILVVFLVVGAAAMFAIGAGGSRRWR